MEAGYLTLLRQNTQQLAAVMISLRQRLLLDRDGEENRADLSA